MRRLILIVALRRFRLNHVQRYARARRRQQLSKRFVVRADRLLASRERHDRVACAGLVVVDAEARVAQRFPVLILLVDRDFVVLFVFARLLRVRELQRIRAGRSLLPDHASYIRLGSIAIRNTNLPERIVHIIRQAGQVQDFSRFQTELILHGSDIAFLSCIGRFAGSCELKLFTDDFGGNRSGIRFSLTFFLAFCPQIQFEGERFIIFVIALNNLLEVEVLVAGIRHHHSLAVRVQRSFIILIGDVEVFFKITFHAGTDLGHLVLRSLRQAGDRLGASAGDGDYHFAS